MLNYAQATKKQDRTSLLANPADIPNSKAENEIVDLFCAPKTWKISYSQSNKKDWRSLNAEKRQMRSNGHDHS